MKKCGVSTIITDVLIMKQVFFTSLLMFLGFTVQLSSQTVPFYVPLDSLVGWWSFNGNAQDESGNGLHGTVYGAVLTTNRHNHTEAAYYFGGNNQQIQCPNSPLLTNSKNLTAAAWFYVENRPGGWEQNVILSNIGQYKNSGGFEITTSNPPNAELMGMFRNETYNDQEIFSNNLKLVANTWYHFVYTLKYNNSTNKTVASIYFNGKFHNSATFTGHIVYNNITPFLIGVNIDSIGHERAFKGKIDDVGLWGRVLTPEEIEELYEAINTGIQNTAANESISVTFNYHNNQIIIRSSSENIGNAFYLTDVTGKRIHSGKLSEYTTINLNSRNKGIYILKIQCDKVITKKIIVN